MEQPGEIKASVDDMLKSANNNGLSDDENKDLKMIVSSHVDIFRVSFSPGPLATLPPLKVYLMPD